MLVKLVKKLDEARLTKSFFFEPSETVTWESGQYFYITLPKLSYPDERGDTRHFTISSSPTEGNLIRITTRVREQSGYKKTLDELPLGSNLEGKGPNGLFVLNPKSKNQNVFLAGGIGVTPFRAMVKYNKDKGLNLSMHLIYSNSDSEFVFKKELDDLLTQDQNLKINYIDTSKDGRLDKNKLLSLTSDYDIQKTTFWVVGPPPFVDAMEVMLEDLNISEDNIKSEKFSGY